MRLDFDRRTGRLAETTAASSAPPSVHWPDVSTAKNIVLDADLAGHAAAEGSLYDDGRVCALWDEVDNMEVDMEVDMEIEEQAAQPTVEQEEA